ncbi:MAG TPA: hypothetical protein PKE30_12710 [Niabella sp.]|nr:hypothetical protein [Niabella sp.]
MRILKILVILAISINLAACCHSKKQKAPPPAKEVLHDRNTRDPKIQEGPPKTELQDTTTKKNQ